jgi:acyl dehydratase
LGGAPPGSGSTVSVISRAPVPVDAWVRARAEVVSIDEKGGGWWEVVTRFTLEVEDNEKPCFVGDSVTRVMAAAD